MAASPPSLPRLKPQVGSHPTCGIHCCDTRASPSAVQCTVLRPASDTTRAPQAPPLQPKSDISDFGHSIVPNSGKPEFGCGESLPRLDRGSPARQRGRVLCGAESRRGRGDHVAASVRSLLNDGELIAIE